MIDTGLFPFYEMDYSSHELPDDFHLLNEFQDANSLCEKLINHIELIDAKRMTQYITKEAGIYKVTVEKL